MSHKITSANEYQKAAIRTLPIYGYEKDVLHCVMGMSGETGEYVELDGHDKAKIVAELGDCFWYAASLAHLLSVPFTTLMEEAAYASSPYRRGHEALVVYSARMLDQVKKTVFYGKKLDEKILLGNLTLFCCGLIDQCLRRDVKLEDVWTANIAKLLERFPVKYEDSLAINRNEEAELKAVGL